MLGAQAGMVWMPDGDDVSTQPAASSMQSVGAEVCCTIFERTIVMNAGCRTRTLVHPCRSSIRLRRPTGTPVHWTRNFFNHRVRVLSWLVRCLCLCPRLPTASVAPANLNLRRA